MRGETATTETSEAPAATGTSLLTSESPAAETPPESGSETTTPTTEEKPAGTPPAAEVPENYEFKLPEGMEMDESLLGEATPLFKELGLSQESAQKVIDLYADKIAPAFVKKQTDDWQATQTGWIDAVKSDAEIGGSNFEASIKDAQRTLNTIGTPELRKTLDDYGIGNNPELVRVFARMAKNLKEDVIVDGSKTKAQLTGPERYTNALYGNK